MDDGTVIGRGLEILQTVSSGIQVPLAELTKQTGIPKPTARRIAEDLKRRGVLIRTPGGYRVGPALERVGMAAALQRKLPDAHDHLTDLHVHVGGIAWLGLLRPTDSTELRPIDLVTDAELATAATAGWPDPTRLATLTGTAGGRLVLARRPDLMEQVARTGLHRSTPKSPPTVRELGAVMRQTRDLGASVESEQFTLGWRCVAAEFQCPDGTIGIIGATARVTRSDAHSMVRWTLRVAESLALSARSG